MAAGKIRVVLDIDDKGFHARMEKAGKVTRDFTKELRNTQKSIKNIEHGVTGLLPRLRDYAITASILKGGISNLAHVTVGWQKTLLDNIGNVERMTFLLKGMSNAATDAGRILESQQNLGYMLDMAEKAPFSLNEMTNSFVKFKSVGLDPMDGSLKSLTDAVASFGGNDQILHRASVAIQQMAGKGVISMEELRQQLGEAVPNAIKLMARSMGMTYQQLVQAVSKGRVEAKSALARMFSEFERTMGGSSERMMETWSGMLAKLQTRWLKFQLALGETGYFQEVKDALAGVLEEMTPERLAEIASSIGKALLALTKGIISITKTIYEWREEIALAVKAIGGLFIITKLAGAIRVLGTAIASIPSLLAMTASMSGFGTAAAATTVKLTALKVSLTGLGRAIMFALGGPLGLLVAALGTAALAWDHFGNSAKDASEKVKNAIDSINEDDLNALGAKRIQMEREVDNLKRKLDSINKNQGKGFYPTLFGDEQDVVDGAVSRYENGLIELNKLKEDFAAAAVQLGKMDSRKAIAQTEETLKEQIAAASSAYRREADLLHEKLENESVTREEYQSKQIEIASAYYDAELSLRKEKLAQLVQELASFTNVPNQERKVTSIGKQIEDISEKIAKLQDSKDRALTDIDTGPVLTEGSVGNGVRNMEKYLEKLTTKMMEYSGTLQGVSTELDQFNYLVDQGAFGKLGTQFKQEDIDRARYLLKVIMGMKDAMDESKTVENINGQIAKSYSKITDQVSSLKSKINENAVATPFTDGLLKQLNAMLTKLPEGSAAIAKLKEAIADVGSSAVSVDLFNHVSKIKDETISIEQSMYSERERIADEYRRNVEHIGKLMELAQTRSAEERLMIEKALLDKLAAMTDRYVEDTKTPMQKLNDEWQKASEQMGQALTDWANQATDAIVEMARTGKFSFTDLADSIIADILRIMVQKTLTGPLAAAFGFANGGIMTGSGPLPLQTYSTGGIATSPQLALFGEGSQPEAYVPLPDGRTIPVTMSGAESKASAPIVNVINQTGVQADVEQNTRFDGEQMILDVVLKAMNKPGSFRDSVKRINK